MWIPAGFLLKAAVSSTQTPQNNILGLSTPIAAGSIVLCQWSLGAMYFVFLAVTARIRGEDFLELYQRAYGAEILHYGMLMTFYCAHHLSSTLTIPKKVVFVNKPRKGGTKVVPKSPLASEIDKAEQGIVEKRTQARLKQGSLGKSVSFDDK
jgi:hypothetical protein